MPRYLLEFMCELDRPMPSVTDFGDCQELVSRDAWSRLYGVSCQDFMAVLDRGCAFAAFDPLWHVDARALGYFLECINVHMLEDRFEGDVDLAGQLIGVLAERVRSGSLLVGDRSLAAAICETVIRYRYWYFPGSERRDDWFAERKRVMDRARETLALLGASA